MTGKILSRLVVNGLVIWLANMFFGNRVALGTMCISKTWAVIYSGVALTLINMLLAPLAEKVKEQRMASSFLINALGVWLVGRLAKNLGMGISSWLVAVLMGMVLTAIQGVVDRKVNELVKR